MRPSGLSVVLGTAVLSLTWNLSLGRATAQHPTGPDAAAITAAIDSSERPSDDRSRDEWAKPQAVLTFLGARPGMQVIDYLAGDGYYSELLARVVGPKGQVIVYNNLGYARFVGTDLVKRFGNRRLPNTLLKVTNTADLQLPEKSLDAALFVMSYHDIYYKPKGAAGPMGDATQVAALLFSALKPGGVVVVQDHVAAAGSPPAESVEKMHRIDPAAVRQTFEQAGFKFDGADDSFKNATDDHSKLVFDPAIRHRTDQFLYRFRKPAK
jgi:predicted methyltransferase